MTTTTITRYRVKRNPIRDDQKSSENFLGSAKGKKIRAEKRVAQKSYPVNTPFPIKAGNGS